MKKLFNVKKEVSKKTLKVTITFFGVEFTIKHKMKGLGFSEKEKAQILSSCKLKSINKKAIDPEIEKFNANADFGKTRDPQWIISLTSFPERIYDIHYALYSLLNQSRKADKVILWLSKKEFPDGLNDVPEKVKAFIGGRFAVKWCSDLKSYNKLIPALKEYPESVIVTADDDIFYPKDWLEKLIECYDGSNIVCHRAHRAEIKKNRILPYLQWEKEIKSGDASYRNFFTGVGGVAYPPGSLHKDVLKEDVFMSLAPKADDIWFWAMAVMNESKIKIVKESFSSLTYINLEREIGINNEKTLYACNRKKGNDKQMKNVLKRYPLVLERLRVL